MSKRNYNKKPKHPLSNSFLKQIPQSPASASKNIFWDARVTGFGAYRTSGDKISFVFQYRIPNDGRTRRATLGELGQLTVDQARALAQTFAYDVVRNMDPIAERLRIAAEERSRNEMVLATYVENYIARRAEAGKPRTEVEVRILRNDVVRLLGTKRLDTLAVTDVETFAAELTRRAPSARRMGLVYLKLILNDAKRRGVILQSPADAIETPQSGERKRKFTDWEIQRYMEAARDVSGPRADIYELLMRLLKRKEEVSRMVWEELDLDKGEWSLPKARTKGREDYTIKLPQQAIRIILSQQPDPALRRGPVFTMDGGKTSPEMGSQPKDILDACMHRRVTLANARDGTAKSVAHFTVHDVRTTGASRNQQKPLLVRRDIIDYILLHVGGDKISRIYQQADMIEEIGDHVQAWNDWLDALMSAADAWPGGRDLPPLSAVQVRTALPVFREGWPKRADQIAAEAAAKAAKETGAAPRGRRAKDRARRGTSHQPQ